METRRRSPLRLLAPVAIVAFAVALLALVTLSGGEEEGQTTREAAAAKQRDLGRTTERRKQKRREGKLPQGAYVVKTGDTLAGIAEKTGVPIDKLRELNPELDPQALVSGQRIKLRE